MQVFFAFSAQAQITYKGPFTVAKTWSGEAVYEFQSVKGKEVLDGDFKFSSHEVDPIDSTRTRIIDIEGEYSKGVKTGVWTFKQKLVSYSGLPQFTNYQAVFPVTGRELSIRAEFKEGKAHGNWQMMEQTIQSGQAIDTLSRVDARFSNGVFTGKFTGQSRRLRLEGEVDAEGFVDKVWKFRSNDDVLRSEDRRSFEHGFIRDHAISSAGETIAIAYPGLASGDSSSRVDEIELSDLYFSLLATTRQVRQRVDNQNAERRANDRSALNDGEWRMFIDALLVVDGIDVWEELPGGAEIENLKVRVMRAAYQAGDSLAIASFLRTFEATTLMAQQILQDPVVELGRFSNEEASFSYAALQVIYSKLMQLEPVVRLLNDQLAPYVSIDFLMEERVPKLQFPAMVRYEYNGEPYDRAYDFPREAAQLIDDVQQLESFIDLLQDHVLALEASIEGPLERYLQEVALRETEAALLALRDSVHWYFGGDLPPNGGMLRDNPYYARFAPTILSRTEDALSRYAVLPTEEKAAAADSLMQCFEAALAFHSFLKQLPLRVDRVKEEYTRTVWNAYTFTYMDEVVKERLFRAYESILLPNILLDIERMSSLYLLKSKQENVTRLIDRMLVLREQDTKDLERQVRKQSNPVELAKILEIQLHLGEDLP